MSARGNPLAASSDIVCTTCYFQFSCIAPALVKGRDSRDSRTGNSIGGWLFLDFFSARFCFFRLAKESQDPATKHL
jgi:hypothetical protein